MAKDKIILGKLISRANYPIDIEYDGKIIRLSPREISGIVDKAKLGILPNTVIFKQNS